MSPDPGLELEGPIAIPRSNGEPVFGAPWQSRVFGMAIVLHESGAFEWEDFRARLIEQIRRAEADPGNPGKAPDPDGSLYYTCWLNALSAVLDQDGVVPGYELTGRCEDFLSGARDEVH